MHALRRHLCQALTILVFANGAYILLRSLTAQALRLQHHTPAFPGCPDTYCDFSVFWLAGRLATAQGAASVYQSAHFFAAAAQMLPHEIYGMPFMYPPPMLPLITLISRPPLAVGYYAFMAASITAAILLLRRARIPWFCIAAGLLGPAGLWCLYLGQFGILCSALLIAGLTLLESQPTQGGGLLALLCIKPQYALLAPIVLLARGNVRSFAGAAITFAALLALAFWAFGWAAWAAFLGAGSETIRALLQEPFMASPRGPAFPCSGWRAASARPFPPPTRCNAPPPPSRAPAPGTSGGGSKWRPTPASPSQSALHYSPHPMATRTIWWGIPSPAPC
jgi:hypothetical protein